MAYMSSAGSQIAISSGVPATEDAAGYAALSWVTIGECTDLQAYGREYNLITHNPVGDRVTRKLKGSYSGGTMALSYAFDPLDNGQQLLKTASESDAAYSIRITMQNGFKAYFRALVMSAKREIGSVDSVTSGTSDLEVTSNIVEVPA